MNQKACHEFALALEKFLLAVVGGGDATFAPEIITDDEPLPAAPVETPWPKNFTAWLKSLPTSTEGYEVLKGISVTKWTKDMVAIVCLSPMAIAMGETATGELLHKTLNQTVGFKGNVDVRLAVADVGAKKEEPKKEPVSAPTPKVSADDVKRVAVQLATKLGDKKRVLEIIAQHGASKVDDIDPSKYSALKSALELALETSPQMG